MTELKSLLKDIDDIDPLSFWLFDAGVYAALALIAVAAAAAAFWLYQRKQFTGSWRYGIWLHLQKLERELTPENAQQTLRALSEILRFAALMRHSRRCSAGIIGNEWLRFLTRNDPGSFDWQARGQLLLAAPYAPKSACCAKEVKKLIVAARRWVK